MYHFWEKIWYFLYGNMYLWFLIFLLVCIDVCAFDGIPTSSRLHSFGTARYSCMMVESVLARCRVAAQDPVRVQQLHVHGALSSVGSTGEKCRSPHCPIVWDYQGLS
jgi:hypothetical protein